MTIDRKKDPLFIFLLDEARELKLEDAEECICIECLINVIETFWKNKRIAVKLDLLEKLINLSNKLREYIFELRLEESKKLSKLHDEFELERSKIEVQENINNLDLKENIYNMDL
jgi:hypothetical protein